MQRYIYLIITLLLFSEHVFAVGFEQAKLHSHLGEPLDVRVGLLLDDGEDLSQSRVELASPREYHALEQTLPQSYYDVRVDIEGADTSKPVAHITSEVAIDESIMALVLKVKRGRGNYFKKIQLLLDAAPHMQLKKKPVLKKVPDTVARFSPVAVSADQDVQNVGSANAASHSTRGGWARRNSYGPVQYGDSLSEIAYRLRRDKRWSNKQIMLALYQSNPDAFVNQDINQLKKGSFLTVPDDAAVKGFVNSKRYQELQDLQKPVRAKPIAKKKKVQTVEPVKPKAQEEPRFQGRISLGIAEPVDVPVVDVMMLKRLEKLEPLYEQAMAADLRMDDIGGKVDLLTKEVAQLQQKIDALAALNVSNAEDNSYGWMGFFLLLVLNIALVAAYFYRKQMKEWQVKLADALQQNTHRYSDNEPERLATPVPMAQPFMDNSHEDEHYADEVHHNEIFAKKVSVQEVDDMLSFDSELEASENIDAAPLDEGELVDEDVSFEQDESTEEDVSTDEDVSADEEEDSKPKNYAIAFEEMVRKHDWDKADEYYSELKEEQCNLPRIQALLVEKLHRQGDFEGRNVTLLALFNLYEDKEWHRFCSFFDDAIWYTLQDENIISYTGKVNAEEVDKAYKESKMKKAEPEPVLDLSQSAEKDEDLSELVISDEEFEMGDVLPSPQQPNSIAQALGQDDDLIQTVQIKAKVPEGEHEDEVEGISPLVKVEDDDGLEVDFEFDFSSMASVKTEEDNTLSAAEPMHDPWANFDTNAGNPLNFELDDTDLEVKKKD